MSIKFNDLNKLKYELENKVDISIVNTMGLNIDGCLNNIDKLKQDFDLQFKEQTKQIKKLQQSTDMLDSINEFDKSLKSIFEQFDNSKKMCVDLQSKFDTLATVTEVKEALN